MHPTVDRLAAAYRPLAGRNRLVEGPHRWPSAASARPRPRMTLLALVAALLGRKA